MLNLIASFASVVFMLGLFWFTDLDLTQSLLVLGMTVANLIQIRTIKEN